MMETDGSAGKKSHDRKMETDFQLTVFPPEESN